MCSCGLDRESACEVCHLDETMRPKSVTIAEFRKRKRQLRLLRARSGRIGRVVTRPIPDLEIRICGKAGGLSQLPLVLYPEHGRESIPLTYPLLSELPSPIEQYIITHVGSQLILRIPSSHPQFSSSSSPLRQSLLSTPIQQ
jgi:hypothetical protein